MKRNKMTLALISAGMLLASSWKKRAAKVAAVVMGSAFAFGLPSAHATILDLTATSSTGTINGGIFQTPAVAGVSGTGVIDPFVRIQGDGTESGYNTSGTLEFQTKPGTWTHPLQLSDIQTNKVIIGGVSYYQFVLDINQNQGQTGELLSLHELEFYTSSVGNNTDYAISPTNLGTMVWDMDAIEDSGIELDYSNFSGSGKLDMFAMIPTAVFGSDMSAFIYLYSAFGIPNPSNDGFEEWAHKTSGFFECIDCGNPPPAEVPEPGTLALVGLALLGVVSARRRKQ